MPCTLELDVEALHGPNRTAIGWIPRTASLAELTGPTQIAEFRMICGKTEQTEFADWAERMFAIFRIPVATVRLLRNAHLEFSAMEILPYKLLTPVERKWAQHFAETSRG